jgi:hypothetical protein
MTPYSRDPPYCQDLRERNGQEVLKPTYKCQQDLPGDPGQEICASCFHESLKKHATRMGVGTIERVDLIEYSIGYSLVIARNLVDGFVAHKCFNSFMESLPES